MAIDKLGEQAQKTPSEILDEQIAEMVETKDGIEEAKKNKAEQMAFIKGAKSKAYKSKKKSKGKKKFKGKYYK